MIIYNKKESYMIHDESMIPMGSLIFDPVNNQLAMKVDENDLTYLGNFYKTEFVMAKAPTGTQVAYLPDEIRIMIPANTNWDSEENASLTGKPGYFYIEVRAYAPEEADHYKDTDEVLTDFSGSYVKTDDKGTYVICYYPIAVKENDVWNYYGKKSTIEHRVGWDYYIDWFTGNKKISGDKIRITLSNESCHE